MGKSFHNDVLDGALNIIKNNGTQIHFCSQEPTTYTQAASTYKLISKTGLTAADYTGPSDNGGAGGGRLLTVNAISAMTPASNGTVTHAAIVDSVNSKLLAVDTVTSQAVTTSQSWSSPAFDIIMKDPT